MLRDCREDVLYFCSPDGATMLSSVPIGRAGLVVLEATILIQWTLLIVFSVVKQGRVISFMCNSVFFFSMCVCVSLCFMGHAA